MRVYTRAPPYIFGILFGGFMHTFPQFHRTKGQQLSPVRLLSFFIKIYKNVIVFFLAVTCVCRLDNCYSFVFNHSIWSDKLLAVRSCLPLRQRMLLNSFSSLIRSFWKTHLVHWCGMDRLCLYSWLWR